MNSMSRHFKPSDIAAQLRMERQHHKGAFILFEGSNDIRRFKKFFDEKECSFVNCYGKNNVIGSIEIEQNLANENVLGFIDNDFEKILGNEVVDDDIICSFGHDFDLDVCASDALIRYLDEVADGSKVAAHGGHNQCIENLLQGLKPLSALRFANERHELGYYLKDLEHDTFFDGRIVDVTAMIDHVSVGRFSSPDYKTNLRQYVGRYTAAEFDLWQFTNGHDFVAGLGLALRELLGSRRHPQTWRVEVERHLRLTFDRDDFDRIGCLPQISEWETRSGYRVLRAAS